MSTFTTSRKLAKLPKLQRRDGQVRVVKDLLRVGKWNAGGKTVEFTASDLDAIAKRFADHKAAGIRHPLTWGHREPGAGDVSERQSIADIEDVFHEDGTLYFTAYMPVQTAGELMAKRREVSIGLDYDWLDGSGTHWEGASLTHAAIVAHAVVPGQQPFIELGRGRPSREPSRMDLAIAKAELIAALPGGGRRVH